MTLILALLLPALMLFVLVVGYLATVFEPYFAMRTAEGLELMEHYAADLKLRLLAEWWAARLTDQDGWYDGTDASARGLYTELHGLLVRHRFIFGDDPRKMRWGTSCDCPILREATKRRGIAGANSSKHMAVSIAPNLVKSADGQVIWRGRPLEHKSRFCDMYSEP